MHTRLDTGIGRLGLALTLWGSAMCVGGCSTSNTSANTTADAAPPPGPLTIQTPKGAVQGGQLENARQFLGIPYAAPPVGPLRWKPPQEATAWTGTRGATAYGHHCTGTDLVKGTFPPPVEDCLYLNVFTPLAAPAKPAPVLLFIHGGGFLDGSGDGPTYAGGTLAGTTGAIVVTFNYRLGVMGFLTHSAFATELGRAASPPFGLLDQRMAMQWVKDNIGAFGGDPNDVTIFGESAGGTSVCLQLAMPGSRGLFHRAIMESGPCGKFALFTAEQGLKQGDDAAKALGCTDAATAASCLRGKSADEVMAALPIRKGLFSDPGVLWQPVLDGTELLAQPLDAFAGGQPSVPVILGTNRDEGNLFTFLWPQAFGHEITNDETTRALQIVWPAETVAKIDAYYPKAALAAPERASLIITDGLFVCPTRKVARVLSSHGTPTYTYRFTHDFNMVLLPGVRAAHSVELPFVFGTTLGGKNIGDDERPLSEAIMGYWSRFGATGDPNGAGAVPWPRYDAAGDKHLDLDTAIVEGSGNRKEACDFWDTVF